MPLDVVICWLRKKYWDRVGLENIGVYGVIHCPDDHNSSPGFRKET